MEIGRKLEWRVRWTVCYEGRNYYKLRYTVHQRRKYKHKEEDDDVLEEMNEEIPEDILNKHV